jgi:hypothetical protein
MQLAEGRAEGLNLPKVIGVKVYARKIGDENQPAKRRSNECPSPLRDTKAYLLHDVS